MSSENVKKYLDWFKYDTATPSEEVAWAEEPSDVEKWMAFVELFSAFNFLTKEVSKRAFEIAEVLAGEEDIKGSPSYYKSIGRTLDSMEFDRDTVTVSSHSYIGGGEDDHYYNKFPVGLMLVENGDYTNRTRIIQAARIKKAEEEVEKNKRQQEEAEKAQKEIDRKEYERLKAKYGY